MAALSTYCYEGLEAIIATATAPPEQPSASPTIVANSYTTSWDLTTRKASTR